MKQSYQVKLEETLNSLNHVPKLLLHSCCGPCSSYVIDYLSKYFDITVYFFNPNIEPIEEYLKRKEEQIKFIKNYTSSNKLDIIDDEYTNDEFNSKIKGFEEEKEGLTRCSICMAYRLNETYIKAKNLGYDYFGTTLTVSPHKNSEVINNIGSKLEKDVKFLYSDFKKKEGYKKSIELAKKFELYRQDYCGCKYSKKDDNLVK